MQTSLSLTKVRALFSRKPCRLAYDRALSVPERFVIENEQKRYYQTNDYPTYCAWCIDAEKRKYKLVALLREHIAVGYTAVAYNGAVVGYFPEPDVETNERGWLKW